MNVEHSKWGNEEPREVTTTSSGPSPTLIGLGVVIVLFIVFFLQNSKTVKINFLFFEKDTTIRWSLLVAVVLGVAADRIFSIWWRRRRKSNDAAD
jgi:uncharacterized integral membrane protein